VARPEKNAPKEWVPQLVVGLLVGLPLAILVAPHCQRQLRIVGVDPGSTTPGIIIVVAITVGVILWVYRRWGR